MKKPTLLILAAGMGSRYGSLKQLDGVGPANETIIDYSVYDAIQAGFGKVVFVIRSFFAEDFKARITNKFSDQIEVVFAFQEVNTPISGIDDLPERAKPWGTAHAVLVTDKLIEEPFAVINADDYYGSEAFAQMANFLTSIVAADHYSMVGFQLTKTLSDNGTVSRGVCEVDERQLLKTVTERTKIKREGAQINYYEGDTPFELAADAPVSMNFWGFHNTIFPHIHSQFKDFVRENSDNPKAEFYIPLVVNNLLQRGVIKVSVLNTADQWYGVTYKEDKPSVQSGLIA